MASRVSHSALYGGLNEAEAAARLRVDGPNELPDQSANPWWKIFGRQFVSLLVIILAGAAAVSASVGELKDAIAIGAILLLNALLGFVQEYRAERASAALRRLCTPVVTVWRGGQSRQISSVDLVVGDLCFVDAGSVLPADGELLSGSGILVDESVLTGESEAISKTPAPQRGDHLLFAGSRVHKGQGSFLVSATGVRTKLGEVAALVKSLPRPSTPMQKQLARLTSRVAIVVAVVVAVFFTGSVYAGANVKTMFLTAVSMAVAALPEGLPAVITIVLALGAQRLLRRNVLVRRLTAIETLGGITAICSDKTGTLTENRITLTSVWTHNGLSGVAPADIARSDLNHLLLVCGVLCNEAQTSRGYEEGGQQWVGDPVDIALMREGCAAGIQESDIDSRFPRITDFPFDSDRRAMTTFRAANGSDGRSEFKPILPSSASTENGFVEITKGAPEIVFAACDEILTQTGRMPFEGDSGRAAIGSLKSLTQAGYRVLAVAIRWYASVAVPNTPSANGMTLIGLLSFQDPPRADSASALATCRNAGIRTFMITGDHPSTARGIAEQLGFDQSARVLKGDEVAAMSGPQLREAVTRVSIYARMKPEQKLSIIQALQQRGEVVAATGDGVNDAPCLTAADVGIAMGTGGTDVARESATIILRDNSFASIAAGIREGRIIFANLQRFILYLFACNSAELAVMLFAPLASMSLPLSPVQILWMNLITDSLPALALGVAPGEKAIMERPPRNQREPIISRSMAWNIAVYGLLMASAALGAGYLWGRVWPMHWNTAVFTTLTLAQILFALGLEDQRALSISAILANRSLVAAVLVTSAVQLATILFQPLQTVLRTQTLSVQEIAVCVLISLLPLAVLQCRKWLQQGEA